MERKIDSMTDAELLDKFEKASRNFTKRDLAKYKHEILRRMGSNTKTYIHNVYDRDNKDWKECVSRTQEYFNKHYLNQWVNEDGEVICPTPTMKPSEEFEGFKAGELSIHKLGESNRIPETTLQTLIGRTGQSIPTFSLIKVRENQLGREMTEEDKQDYVDSIRNALEYFRNTGNLGKIPDIND